MTALRLLFALTLVVLFSCANRTDPVTGKGYYSPIGNDYESQLQYVRRHFLPQITTVQDGGDLNEPDLVASCEEVFRRVVEAIPESHKRDFRFDLKVGAATAINAYTYGAGFVRCNLGLVAYCEDASELAGIFAHELGHNSHDHIGQSIGRTTISSEVLGLGGVLGRPGAVLGHLAGGGIAALTLTKYSRDQELQADRRAVDYTLLCRYDPDGLARFFARLDEEERRRGRPPLLFQTHPYSATRVADIRAAIASRPGGVPADAVRQTERFRAAIDRAREILPYYEKLEATVQGDDVDATLAAARAGADALPHHAAFHFWVGTVLQAQEKPQEAVVALRRADQLDRTNFLVPLMRAMLELETGNPPEAELAATKLLGLMPALPQGYLIRGIARVQQKRPEEGFPDLDAGLARLERRSDRRAVAASLEKNVPGYAEHRAQPR